MTTTCLSCRWRFCFFSAHHLYMCMLSMEFWMMMMTRTHTPPCFVVEKAPACWIITINCGANLCIKMLIPPCVYVPFRCSFEWFCTAWCPLTVVLLVMTVHADTHVVTFPAVPCVSFLAVVTCYVVVAFVFVCCCCFEQTMGNDKGQKQREVSCVRKAVLCRAHEECFTR